MADPRLMDQAFQRLMRSLVESGRALHYAELSAEMGCSVEEGRQLLVTVMQAYPIGWLHPDTDYIASFPPLNSLPTQYRVTVRGGPRRPVWTAASAWWWTCATGTSSPWTRRGSWAT